ncbi:ubiquitin ligase complex subunit HRD3 [Sporobolomyces koalae]|uniref:ubiquitin ligase complex subunit HRD3 n=1 Tax=Sporobolomyces koalae TaxID=500713 RepID=UPI0031733F77
MRAVGVYVQLCLVLHVVHAQHQLAFGLHTGQNLRQHDGTRRTPPAAAPPAPALDLHTLSPQDLHDLAVSLLDSITLHTAHADPRTPYLPHLATVSTSSSLLDPLERHLGTNTVNAIKTLVERLYAGRPKDRSRGEWDLSIKRAVLALKQLVDKFTIDRPSSSLTRSSRAARDPTRWRERLNQFATGAAATLNDQETTEAIAEVVRLLTRAGEQGSGPSWTLLGDLHLTGHLTLPSNSTRAFEFYTLASERSGDSDAQYKLGFLYGTNYGRAVPERPEGRGHQGSALLHYTFAALSGHVPASMTVGYRHWAGIGTKQSCQDALPWYKSAAEAAVRTFNSGPPGGRHLSPAKLRLSDLSGGVYGPGASSKPPTLSTGGSTSQTKQEWNDLIEFHQFHADRGDPAYMYRLAKLYYGGFGVGDQHSGTRPRLNRARASAVSLGAGGRDFGRSFKWFAKLGKQMWTSDGREAMWDPKWGTFSSSANHQQQQQQQRSVVVDQQQLSGSGTNKVGKLGFYDPKLDRKSDRADDATQMLSGLAAGYLGKMYLRGEGVNVNLQKAFLWFKRGSTRLDRECHNGLGIMYRDGLGVERNLKIALAHFHAAAQQDLAEAQVNLGKYHFGRGENVLATGFFEAAIRSDGMRQTDTFQSYYYLAELAAQQGQPSTPNAGAVDHCPVMVSFYKHVAERGDWDHEVWFEAEKAREQGDLRTALLGYWIMAERGYEVAQNNVAWILDRDKSRIRVPLLDQAPVGSDETDRIALTYWTRSAAQDNVDALVKLGDYYFKGIGRGTPQYEKAATFYQSAATSRLSAMAMWNLGWMHETGHGVPQDFHLAKRYLDSALETSPNAYFPSSLSLISLYLRAMYHVVFSPSDEMNALSVFGKDPDPLSPDQEQQQHGFVPQGGWGFGRAWRDIQRSWGFEPGPEPEPVAYHQGTVPGKAAAEPAAGKIAKRASVEGEQQQFEYGQDQVTRSRSRPGAGEDEEDEFYIEDEGDFGGTVAIIALCMILAWLVYFRQRPQNQRDPHAFAARPVPGQAPAAPQAQLPTPTAPPRVDHDDERPHDEQHPQRLV